jgi:hypothetical protein
MTDEVAAAVELTVGDLRREMDGLPDDAPVFVTVVGRYDLPITWACGGTQTIVGESRAPDAEPPWGTQPGLELHADPEWSEDERDAVMGFIERGLFSGVDFWQRRKMLGLVRKAPAVTEARTADTPPVVADPR